MSVSVPVLLDPSIDLPDGRSNAGPFQHWTYGVWWIAYRIDTEGRLFEDIPSVEDRPKDYAPKLLPLHGFFTFVSVDEERRRYAARFTYGRLDGIRVGEAGVWDDEHR